VFSRLLGCLVALTLAGCAAMPSAPHVGAGPAVATAYVIDRGWHTDIGIAAGDLHNSLPTIEHDFPGARYFVFGFGERAYLLAAHRSILTMIVALLPSPGAILVTALRASPLQAFGSTHVVSLRLSAAETDRLVAFLSNDLDRAGSGQPRRIADGPYPGSAFYAASTTYDAAHTCNTWTIEALEVAGLPLNASGVVFAGQVMHRVRAISGSPNTAHPVVQEAGD
jgi:uncharacterized protein (TIGR02117 family)